jgi:ketosteroid isomerase-like protein
MTKTIASCSLMMFIGISVAFTQNHLLPNEKVTAQLSRFRSDYIRSMINKEPDIMTVYRAEDFRLMPEFQKAILGKTNSAAYYKAFFNRFDIRAYTRKEIELLDLGSMVVEIGIFNETMKLKDSVKDYMIRGKYFNVFKKLANDQLLLLTEAWNYDHSLPDEDQMRFKGLAVYDVALMPHLPVNSNISFELAALNRLMEDAVSHRDASLWLQFYTDDAMMCHSRAPLDSGRAALKVYLEAHCRYIPVMEKLDIRNDRIDNLGNYVIEYASHTAIWRNDESSGVGLGKDLRIWRREKDGSLKIFRHIGMYD